jgi:hypothetical protein
MATVAIVSFGPVRSISSIDVPSIGAMRSAQCFLGAPGLTTDVAQANEIAVIATPGATMLAVATGSAADATATAQTAVTSAAFGIGPGERMLLPVNAGDKVSVKALP